nr:E3 ubiquitin-protein ligase UPL5 [Ipomoea batatas]
MTSNLDADAAVIAATAKRKLDEYSDDAFASECLIPAAVRMRKDQAGPTSAADSAQESDFRSSSAADVSTSRSSASFAAASESSSAFASFSVLPKFSGQFQFFVRPLSGGSTLVLRANSDDLVESIHDKICTSTKIPVFEQRLIYRGKQLQCDQTLAECGIQKDAILELVGRMRSTSHPQAWQFIDDMVWKIFELCKSKTLLPTGCIKTMLMEFIAKIPRDYVVDKASEYLQIFLSSGAPAALVILYMSPVIHYRDCAEESIRTFIISSKANLNKPMYVHFAPIIIEFCKLLNRAVGVNDPLYILCRSSLGSIVESVGKDLIKIEDILPFLSELAIKLTESLGLSAQSSTFMGPSANEVNDFIAFMHPVKREVEVTCAGPITLPLREGTCDGDHGKHCASYYREEIKLLHFIFVDLLEKMGLCLRRMEERLRAREKGEAEPFVIGWYQYLAILKELNGIANLFKGADELFWEMLRQRKVSLCYLVVRFAKKSDDHSWIMKHKEVTNFEARRYLAMMMLPEVKDEYDELHEMLIDRSLLLRESFEYIASADPDALRGGLFMEFKNEEATGPGVLREWFFLVCQSIFNPQNALFIACPNDCRRFFPNPASSVNQLHLEYFRFSGRVIALALMHKIQVGIVFDRVFFLQLAGNTISLEDIQDADPFLYNSCKQILEMDAELVDQDTLGLTFVCEIEELGSRKTVELCPNGKSTVVDSKNRKQYVNLLIQHRFVTSIAEQVAHFAKGFADIISSFNLQRSFFQNLDLEDLDWMLYGSETSVSVEDWKAHTDYHGFKESEPQISWFWEIVGKMTAEQRKVLLFFWTSVKFLPVEGFSGLPSRLYIYRNSEPFDRLPSSHTCFYRLCFPRYPSMAVMQDRFNIITQEHVGCSFGTW